MEGEEERAARVVGQQWRETEELMRAAASLGQMVLRRLSWMRRVSAALQAEG